MKEETDAFENDKEVLKWRKEAALYQQMIDEATGIIATPFNAMEADEKNLDQFIFFKSIPSAYTSSFYEGRWNNKEISFFLFSYETSVNAGRVRSSGRDQYFAGVIGLSRSYPHTMIQPETVSHKIVNLVTKSDIDFKHARKFSRRFHLITKDQDKLEMLLFNKDLNKIARHAAAEIEIIGNQCYFRRTRKPVSIKEAQKFLDLATTLLDILD